MAETLSLQNVSYSYDADPVLIDVSHEFQAGKLTVICGPNGSGKSTLCGVASGMSMPSHGNVFLNSERVADIAPKARAKRMAMLPQSPDAPSELLVRDLVALGRYAYRRPFSSLGDDDKTAIDQALAATDMVSLTERQLSTLSGGQKQRAWIAMIIAQEAPLLLLDEPTNHLDVTHAVETLELLRSFVTAAGKTVVTILHDINLMAAFADDAVLMKDGRVMTAGAFENTVTENVVSELFGRKFQFGHLKGRDRPFIVPV